MALPCHTNFRTTRNQTTNAESSTKGTDTSIGLYSSKQRTCKCSTMSPGFVSQETRFKRSASPRGSQIHECCACHLHLLRLVIRKRQFTVPHELHMAPSLLARLASLAPRCDRLKVGKWPYQPTPLRCSESRFLFRFLAVAASQTGIPQKKAQK